MKKRGISKNFFLLFFLAASYFVLYVLSTFHESYFAVGACGVIFLAAGYLFVSALERERREKEEEQRWQTEQIQKCLEETLQTQRAIHTAIRKANEAMGRQLKDMGGEASGEFAAEEQQKLLQRIAVVQERTISESKRLAEIQVNALKAVAKYNKENARQLALNANENANRIADSVFHIAADLGQRLDGAFERLAERSSVIRAEGMTGSENGMSVLPEASVMPEQEMTEEAEMAKMSALEPTVDPTEEPTGELLAAPTEGLAEEPLPTEEESRSVSLAEPAMESMEESLTELTEESAEQPFTEPVQGAGEELLPESAEEPEISSEPEKIASLPDNPNRAMSSDEIAALVASIGGSEKGEEDITVSIPQNEEDIAISIPEEGENIFIPIPDPTEDPLPELKPEPEVKSEPEKKSPMPVSSDPNHAMSPDEIAALIASMTQ